MSDIFLSYHSSDRRIAQMFADGLEAHGWSVWWDREIPLGKSYDQVIEAELTAARCAIVLWSREAVRSRWVRAEASAAAGRERLVPVMIEDADIPLEFEQIQTAMLVGWAGDTTNPEFTRLIQAIRQLLGHEAAPQVTPQRSKPSRASAPWWQGKRGLGGAVAAAILLIAALTFTIGRFSTGERATDQGSPVTVTDPGQSNSGGSAASTVRDRSAAKGPAGNAISIKVGDRIEDGIPGPGAGSIETPYNMDAYTFTATPGQRVYFRMMGHSNGLAYLKWKLTDENGMDVFNTCLGCSEPGVQSLHAGGTYTLTVGSEADPATGTYRLRLFDVPPPSQFSVKVGDPIREGTPGTGAGAIESPGAEDVYSFAAIPRQRVYFRKFEFSTGMDYMKWALTDEDGMEVFNTCLGCTEPGVQTLTKGGTYKLTVGNLTAPVTGTYRLQLLNVPAPNQFSIRFGDRIGPGVPGTGAGFIESPGAEDVYSFTASPGQRASFRLLERDKGMDYIQWRLTDDNGMELFKTCLGCSAPGVQQLTRGGTCTLAVGNTIDPSTGRYTFELGSP